jgi:hypothetical protein
MLTRRTIMLGAASTTFAALAATARADVTALAFVCGIYGACRRKNAKGIALDSDAVLRRYFEPSLAALIVKDQKDVSAAPSRPLPSCD